MPAKRNEYEGNDPLTVLEIFLRKLRILEFALLAASDDDFEHDNNDIANMAYYLVNVDSEARKYIDLWLDEQRMKEQEKPNGGNQTS